METLVLRDGCKIPKLGFGTYMIHGETLGLALKHGYRLLDTATLYG